jgi:heat shock protein HslJ
MKTTRSALVAIVLAVAVTVTAALAGCSSVQPAPSSPTPSATPTASVSAGPSTTPTGSPSSPIGSWGEDGAGKPNADFNSDGTVSGSDGCNHFSGTWTDSAGTIEVGALVSTLMACSNMDTWLAMMTSVKVQGDTLVVYKGTERLGTLARS